MNKTTKLTPTLATSSTHTEVMRVRELMSATGVSVLDLFLADIAETLLDDQGAYLRPDGSDLDVPTAYSITAETLGSANEGRDGVAGHSELDEPLSAIRAILLNHCVTALRGFAADCCAGCRLRFRGP